MFFKKNHNGDNSNKDITSSGGANVISDVELDHQKNNHSPSDKKDAFSGNSSNVASEKTSEINVNTIKIRKFSPTTENVSNEKLVIDEKMSEIVEEIKQSDVIDDEEQPLEKQNVPKNSVMPLSDSDVSKQLENEKVPSGATKKKLFSLTSIFTKIKLNNKQKSFMYMELGSLLSSGVPVSQALSILGKQSSKGNLGKVIDYFQTRVDTGSSFSKTMRSMGDAFKDMEIALVEAGEESGNLAKVFVNIGKKMSQDGKILRKVRNAMIYPIIVLILLVVSTIGMLIFVVPKLTTLYSSFNAEMPWVTKLLLAMSDFFKTNYLYIFIVIVSLAIIFNLIIRTKKGKLYWHIFLFWLPGVNIVLKQYYFQRFSETLGLLYSSGVSIVEALNITSKSIGNSFIESHITRVSQKVISGINLSQALEESKIFPSLIIEMMRLGESNGSVDKSLKDIDDYYSEKVEDFSSTIPTLVEPIMILVVGAIVTFVLFAVMMPAYTLVNFIAE
jgi:type IV pilus assembly protein PilC